MKKLHQIYPHATKWQVVKYRVRIACIKMFFVIVGLGVISWSYILGSSHSVGSVVYADREVKVVVDNLSVKIDELKDSVLDDLKQCESGKATEDDAVINHDDGGSASYGLYQFKIATVKHYMDKDMTNLEALQVAMSGERSRQLAKEVIFGVQGGIWNWENCAVDNDLIRRVTIIKELEK